MLPRDSLPQIPEKEFDAFRKYCHGEGVTSHIMRISCDALKPIQKHLNPQKIKRIIENPSGMDVPIIISEDNYLLDGHHRWAAELVQDRSSKIICLQFNCKIPKLVELGHLFEGSFIKSIDESTTYS